MENVEIQSVEARRSFLKKVAYVAPAVVVLGSLTLPSSAQASTFTAEIFRDNTKIADVSVYGNSGTGVLDTPTAGAKVRTTNGSITTYTQEQVIANNDDYFTFAKTWFKQILG